METRLFKDSDVFQKERPKRITKEQKEEIFRDIAEDIIDNGWSKSHIDNIIHDLKELSIGIDSGYEMAKKLESYYMLGEYEIDSGFIEFLEGIEYKKNAVLKKNIKDWVKAHNPKPKFNTGDCLFVKETIFFEMKKDSLIYVNSINEETACYHVSNKLGDSSNFVIAYEEIESKCEIKN